MEFTDETPMPFGQYKGEALEDVPDIYLIWFWKNKEPDFRDEKPMRKNEIALMRYIESNLDSLKIE